MTKQNKVIVGKFAAPLGVRGWIKLQSFTHPTENLLDYPDWYVQHQGQWQLLEITARKTHGNFLAVKIKGIDDRDEVHRFTNDLIGIEREQLPPPTSGEFYWHDLIGLTVENLDGEVLGKVTDVLSAGSNDVLQVETPTKKRLIPYTQHAIHKVEIKAGKLIVDWDADF